MSPSVKFIIPHMQSRCAAGLKTLYICGSHDNPGFSGNKLNPPWLEAVRRNGDEDLVYLNDDGPLGYDRLGGFKFMGADAMNRLEFQEYLTRLRTYVEKDGKPDVLVIHQGLKELLGFETGDVKAYDAATEDLAGLARLVICGHVHVTKTWTHRDSGTVFLSPGSGAAASIDEPKKKYFHVVEMSDDAINIQHIEIMRRRKFFDFVAADEAQREETIKFVNEFELDEKLPEELRPGFMRLKYAPCGDFLSRLTESCKGKMFLDAIAVASNSDGEINMAAFADKDAEEPEDVIERITAKHIDADMQPELYKLAVEIQKDATHRPDEIITRLVDKMLESVE